MTTQDFNTGPAPEELDVTVKIGWLYDEVETAAGIKRVLKRDADGNAIAAEYNVPATLSTEDLSNLTKKLGTGGVEGLNARAKDDQFKAFLDLAGALYGDEFVLNLFKNKTITPDIFIAFCNWAIGLLGFGATLPPEDGESPLVELSPDLDTLSPSSTPI